VHLDAGGPGGVPARDRNVHGNALGWVREELEEVDGGSMTDDSTAPAGQNGGHLKRMGHLYRSDSVYAAVEDAQLAPLPPPLYLLIRHPQPHQLRARRRDVLASRQSCDLPAKFMSTAHMGV
jgi:hypothetical protein